MNINFKEERGEESYSITTNMNSSSDNSCLSPEYDNDLKNESMYLSDCTEQFGDSDSHLQLLTQQSTHGSANTSGAGKEKEEPLREVPSEALIVLVRKSPALWDKTCEDYKNRNKVKEAWKNICCKLNPDYGYLSETEKSGYSQLVMKRWTNIRDQFMKWKGREQKSLLAGKRVPRKYIYYNELKFLEKVRVRNNQSGPIVYPESAEADSEQADAEDHPDTAMNPDSITSRGQMIVRAASSAAVRACQDMVAFRTRQDRAADRTRSTTRKQGPDEDESDSSNSGQSAARARKRHHVETESSNDRHIMFFKGIMPSVSKFTDAQTLDFQIGVLGVIRGIHQAAALSNAQRLS